MILLLLLGVLVLASSDRPLVVDLILYNGEPMGLYRLEYLKDVVDLFVLVEATVTFTGKPKEIYLHRKEPIFAELRAQNKTLEIITDSIPKSGSSSSGSELATNSKRKVGEWDREKSLRNIALKKIMAQLAGKQFVLIVTDADELPKREYVSKFSEMYNEIGDGMRLVMISMVYSFQWAQHHKHGNAWYFPYVITDRGIHHRAASLDDMRTKRLYMASMTHVWNAGWHCSYCMNPEDIVRKIESFSHQELNKPQFKDINWITSCIQNGWHLFKRAAVKIRPYQCTNTGIYDGLPICHECNLNSDTYKLLNLHNTSLCANNTTPVEIIYLEYRNVENGAVIRKSQHAFPYIQEYKHIKLVPPLKTPNSGKTSSTITKGKKYKSKSS